MDRRVRWLKRLQSGARLWTLGLELILWLLAAGLLIPGMMVIVMVFVLWLIDPSNDCPTGHSYDYLADDRT